MIGIVGDADLNRTGEKDLSLQVRLSTHRRGDVGQRHPQEVVERHHGAVFGIEARQRAIEELAVCERSQTSGAGYGSMGDSTSRVAGGDFGGGRGRR